jgi:hypothetical protein
MRGALQLASTEPRQGAVGFAATLLGAFILALRCDLAFSVINRVAIVATPGSPDRKAPGLTAAELTAPCLGILGSFEVSQSPDKFLPRRTNSELKNSARGREIVDDVASRRIRKSRRHQLSIERVDQIEVEAKRSRSR